MTALTDWKAIRHEYEISHTSVKELSKCHHVSVILINEAIEAYGWIRKTSEQHAEDAEKLSVQLQSLDLAYQSEHIKAFTRLEAKLLKVASDLLDKVEGLEDAGNVKMISDVVEKTRPAIMAAKKNQQESGKSGGSKIVILNKFDMLQPGDDSYVPPNAVLVGNNAAAVVDDMEHAI